MSAPHGPELGDTAPILRRPPEGREPIHFHTEPPPPLQNPVLVWVLRGLGLLAVAVISGLVWWYINDDSPPPASQEEPTVQQKPGQFEFTPVAEVPTPIQDSNCAEHSYEDIKGFFQKTPCQQLTRALYTTTTTDGRKVYTNVSVVRMGTADDAAELRRLADTEGTGNVNDLILEGRVKVPQLKSVAGGGYSAVQHDRNVIIVESALDPGAEKGDKKADEAVLDAICQDAVRLGDEIS
ncbi:MAG TPA: hypothetical protein VGX25_28350 [Actinophytocola sp.]|uniref:hypothetical protein n=1 Tax=Actinophytocola sp. TaxID=1872138 RepID=UPI002DDD6C4F|nr:hypothetical protein [Actinophytocola sp.]HEV2783314.1 hypothetical protein [Actinophytocola sp.]